MKMASRFREAVLAGACSGQLVDRLWTRWRVAHHDDGFVLHPRSRGLRADGVTSQPFRAFITVREVAELLGVTVRVSAGQLIAQDGSSECSARHP
jgi:hypothetical protein